jgi:uncharacterized protein YbcI
MTEAGKKQQVEHALGQELLHIHEDSYGKGAAKATVHQVDDTVLVFLDGLELQRAEEFLVDSGHEETVIQTRSQFQQAIETTFSAAVERATGRRVTSFASVTKLDPNYACEIFRLAPHPG